MRPSSLVISILLTLVFSTANAVDSCSTLFVSWSAVHSFINKYRESRILPLQPDMPQEESGFKIKGKLGESSAKVYLAIDPKTKTPVVVKLRSSSMSFWRELMITDYLLANGEVVPKILKAFIKKDGSTVVVREYFKGMTGEELFYERESEPNTLPRELSVSAWELLDPEITRLKKLFSEGDENHLSFKDWYRVNSSKLKEKYQENWNSIEKRTAKRPEGMSLINEFLFMQDFVESNFLFDMHRNKWLAYDP